MMRHTATRLSVTGRVTKSAGKDETTTAMNSTSPAQPVNPLVPDSVGALLTEEWTINPHSTLPSFLEMAMIEEVQQSAWQTLNSVMSHLQDRLDRWSQQFLSIGNTEESSSFVKTLPLVLRFPQGLQCLSQKIISPYGPELRFFLVYLLERKSLLSSSAATIAEALHGGRRVKLDADPSSTQGMARQAKIVPMDKRDGIRLAILVTLGRYLMERGDWFHRRLSADSQQFSGLPLVGAQKILKFVYPFLFSTAKGLNLLQKWRFLLGQSVFFDFHSQWLNLAVRRVVAEDSPVPTKKVSAATSDFTTPGPKAQSEFASFWQSISVSTRSRQIALGLLASAVGISWIARLQTTRQRLKRRRLLLEDPKGARPPPPKALPSHSDNNDQTSCPPTHCPLCHSPRINPTASTSGYVFCLACLTTALRSRPVCPITGKDCPESKIVRLFEPHTL